MCISDSGDLFSNNFANMYEVKGGLEMGLSFCSGRAGKLRTDACSSTKAASHDTTYRLKIRAESTEVSSLESSGVAWCNTCTLGGLNSKGLMNKGHGEIT